MVFRKRAIQMTLVKPTGDDNVDDQFDGPERVALYCDIAKDFISFAAVIGGGTYVVCKLVSGVVGVAVNVSRR